MSTPLDEGSSDMFGVAEPVAASVGTGRVSTASLVSDLGRRQGHVGVETFK